MKISETLKEKRIALKLSQKEVAERLLVTRQTISNWENDRSYPDLENLVLLSQLYHFSLDELFRLNKEVPKNLENANRQQHSWGLTMIAVCSVIVVLLVTTFVLSTGGDKIRILDYVDEIVGLIVIFGFGYFVWALDKSKIQLPKKMKLVLNIVLTSILLNAALQFSFGFVTGLLEAARNH